MRILGKCDISLAIIIHSAYISFNYSQENYKILLLYFITNHVSPWVIANSHQVNGYPSGFFFRCGPFPDYFRGGC